MASKKIYLPLAISFILIGAKVSGQSQKNDFIFIDGTTVIVAATKDTVWLAADRRSGFSTPNMIKIKEKNNIFCAFLGKALFINKSNNDTLFNSNNIMEAATAKGRTVFQSFKIFNDSVISKLKYMGEVVSRLDPTKFKSFLNVKSHFSVVMVGFVNDQSVILARSFRFIGTMSTWKVEGGEIRQQINFSGYTIYGKKQYIDRFIEKNPKWFTPDREKLICLIEIEAHNSPDVVSMPVDIVAIYSRGSKWSYNNLKCPN